MSSYKERKRSKTGGKVSPQFLLLIHFYVVASIGEQPGTPRTVQLTGTFESCRHFQLPWAFVDASTPITEGSKFCVCAHEVVAWLMNPLQVLYVDSKSPSSVDQKHQQAAFAYASGTLHGHMLVINNSIISCSLFVIEFYRPGGYRFWNIPSVQNRYLMVNSIYACLSVKGED